MIYKPSRAISLFILAMLPLNGLVMAQGKEQNEKASPLIKATSVPLSATSKAGCVISACDPSLLCHSKGPNVCLEQTCPETAWRVCVEDRGKKGLWVGPVDLKRSPQENWMRVLYEAGLTEIFVPYHEGTTRLRDMQFCPDVTSPDRCQREIKSADVGNDGIIMTLVGDPVPLPRVAVEARDRGVAWLCKWLDAQKQEHSLLRRGEEMLVWGVYDTGNYDYIIQYGFRDDGTITFRLGASGNNNFNFPAEAHMHTSLWRLDVDLNGPAQDSVKLLTHHEGIPTLLTAADIESSFNGGSEGFGNWKPELFTTMLVEDASSNVHGHQISYEIVPLRRGTSRHFDAAEQFTRHDFWATVYHYGESGYVAPFDWHAGGQGPDTYLVPNALQDAAGNPAPEPVTNTDVIVWHQAADHHDPHDEDQAAGDLTGGMKGITLMHWMGFDMVPHNLFDHNPLGGPHRQQCDGAP